MFKFIGLTTLMIVFGTIANAATSAHSTEEVLKDLDVEQFKICMVTAHGPSQKKDNVFIQTYFPSFENVQKISIACDGEVIAKYTSGLLPGSFIITGAQKASKVLLDKGFELKGVSFEKVLILTK